MIEQTVIEPQRAPIKMTEKSDIQLANIEKELSKLWATLDTAGAVRASLFNLIIYTADPDRSDYFRAILQTIAQRFPCRIIFIKGDEKSKEDYLRTSVSAEMSGATDRPVACEKITIEASKASFARVPFLVLPHLQADLPVYLFWGQDPSRDSTILPSLELYADRVIFDSEFCDDLGAFSEKVRSETRRLRCTVADMNWARGHGWRTLFRQTFHDASRMDVLQGCQTLRITYNGKQNAQCRHNTMQAVYLQGWLASQLNWRFIAREQSEGNTRIVYHNGMRECTVLLVPQMGSNTPAGSLLAIDIDGDNDSHYRFSRIDDGRSVQVQSSTADKCEVPYQHLLSSMKREHALLQEVFYRPSSKHYAETLACIAQLTP